MNVKLLLVLSLKFKSYDKTVAISGAENRKSHCKKTLAKIMDQGAKFLCVDSSIFMEMYILRKSISWAYFLDNEFVIHRPPHQLVIYE